MHILINFIHAIGVLIQESGLKGILGRTIGIVDKILTGKKYPQNVCLLSKLEGKLLIDLLKLQEAAS